MKNDKYRKLGMLCLCHTCGSVFEIIKGGYAYNEVLPCGHHASKIWLATDECIISASKAEDFIYDIIGISDEVDKLMEENGLKD